MRCRIWLTCCMALLNASCFSFLPLPVMSSPLSYKGPHLMLALYFGTSSLKDLTAVRTLALKESSCRIAVSASSTIRPWTYSFSGQDVVLYLTLHFTSCILRSTQSSPQVATQPFAVSCFDSRHIRMCRFVCEQGLWQMLQCKEHLY
jgi:hypothetical protein